VTQEVGYLQAPAEQVAEWVQERLGPRWKLRPAEWNGLVDVVRDLAPSPALSRYGIVPIGTWSLLLNNTPLGTDVGVLPSRWARDRGGWGIRAVCVEDGALGYPARILEIFGPAGHGPLMGVRSIAAANDGGRWVFETSGEPLPFENTDAYNRPRKADRFTGEMLRSYLREFEVPTESEPFWPGAFVIEQKPG
jgi:hypothetical protein